MRPFALGVKVMARLLSESIERATKAHDHALVARIATAVIDWRKHEDEEARKESKRVAHPVSNLNR